MNWRDPLMFVGVTLLASCGGSCDEGLPVEDICSGARLGAIDGVEIGKGLPAIFMPLSTNQTVTLVESEELTYMLPVRFRLTGSDIPVCVDQRTRVDGCFGADCEPTTLAQSIAPLRTYPELDGSKETRALYLMLGMPAPEPGTRLELTSEVGGHELAVGVFVGVAGPVDAGPPAIDAAPPIIDAAPPIVDAAPPDAAPP